MLKLIVNYNNASNVCLELKVNKVVMSAHKTDLKKNLFFAFWVALHSASTGITTYGIITNQPFRFYIFSVTIYSINNLVSIFSTSLPILIPISITNLVLIYSSF